MDERKEDETRAWRRIHPDDGRADGTIRGSEVRTPNRVPAGARSRDQRQQWNAAEENRGPWALITFFLPRLDTRHNGDQLSVHSAGMTNNQPELRGSLRLAQGNDRPTIGGRSVPGRADLFPILGERGRECVRIRLQLRDPGNVVGEGDARC